MIVDYVILSSTYVTDLTKHVKDYINKGYIPNGSLVYGNGEFHQAMVKECIKHE